MAVWKVVLTGGPCAGKSTAMERIQEIFEEQGYDVLIVSEVATDLISGGVSPWACRTNLDYQKCQMKMQIEKEHVFDRAARYMKKENVLIVCDRGTLDNKAYMTDEEFAEIMDFVNEDPEALIEEYDGVIHMVTAACGAVKHYTHANNTARTETIEEATDLDDRIKDAWAGHPKHVIIDNSTGFEGKLEKVIDEIRDILKED